MNGVLLKDNTHEKEVYISDCIPLFHQVRIITVNCIQYLHCNCTEWPLLQAQRCILRNIGKLTKTSLFIDQPQQNEKIVAMT